MPRRQSLRLPPQPPPTPMPPSLKQSPYLNAPIFKRDLPTPSLPSEEDEKWLQDTIPISSSSSASALEGGRNSAKMHVDRRGSVAKQPPKHTLKPAEDQCYFHQPSFTHSGHISPYGTPHSPTSNRSRSHSTQQKYLSHSLAPLPDVPLTWSANPKTRPALLNQAHSEPNVARIGSRRDISGYFPRILP
ncbi:hypothetical protein CPC08DRAFT_722374 [Agrocybe pediades]|nr:hypothetical protein CPC08DRAFT_722374 [Agrocybe pediades]